MNGPTRMPRSGRCRPDTGFVLASQGPTGPFLVFFGFAQQRSVLGILIFGVVLGAVVCFNGLMNEHKHLFQVEGDTWACWGHSDQCGLRAPACFVPKDEAVTSKGRIDLLLLPQFPLRRQ